MLLRVGIVSMVFALLVAAVVACLVILSEYAEPATATSYNAGPTETTVAKATWDTHPARVEIPSTQSEKPEKTEPAMIEREAPVETEDPALAYQKTKPARGLPITPENWVRPSAKEIEAAEKPRRYRRQNTALALTIKKLGILNVPVRNSESREALARGVVHLPETPMPWTVKAHKNVYLAGHRLGYPGTGSRLIFYHLDKLSPGDLIVLRDRSDRAYQYLVSEKFVVGPEDGWVMDSVRDRDMVTIQTCTGPNFEKRLVVRADRVKMATLG